MDWTKQISYRVHEAGSSVVKEIFLPTDSRTKANLDTAIVAAFQSSTPIVALLREDRTRIDSDLSVVFLTHSSSLEVYFQGKVRALTFPDFCYVADPNSILHLIY